MIREPNPNTAFARRCLPHPVPDHDGAGGGAALPVGAGHWAAAAAGLPRRVDPHLALVDRPGRCLHHCIVPRGTLL